MNESLIDLEIVMTKAKAMQVKVYDLLTSQGFVGRDFHYAYPIGLFVNLVRDQIEIVDASIEVFDLILMDAEARLYRASGTSYYLKDN